MWACRGARVVVAVLASMALTTASVAAQSRPPAVATQHALDEFANCRAQQRPECPAETATPTLLPTPPPTPTPSPAPAPPRTETPQPTATPEPGLPVSKLGQAVAAYVQPEPRDPTGNWLQIALPQGRWAIRYDTTLCAPPGPWTNVWLALDDQSNRAITADRDDGATCAVSQSSWTSSVPCAHDDQGVCDVALDDAYLDVLAQTAPAAVAIDTPPPTLLPTPQPTELSQAAATAPPRIVVETVVVVVVATAAPTETPQPGPTPPPSPTPLPAPTPQPLPTQSLPTPTLAIPATLAPTPAATATDVATSTPAPLPVAAETPAAPTQAPVAAPQAEQQPAGWIWALMFALLVVLAMGAGVFWLVNWRRRWTW